MEAHAALVRVGFPVWLDDGVLWDPRSHWTQADWCFESGDPDGTGVPSVEQDPDSQGQLHWLSWVPKLPTDPFLVSFSHKRPWRSSLPYDSLIFNQIKRGISWHKLRMGGADRWGAQHRDLCPMCHVTLRGSRGPAQLGVGWGGMDPAWHWPEGPPLTWEGTRAPR